MRRSISFLIALIALALPFSATAAAGKFLFVHGPVTVVDAEDAQRPARRGMDLFEGERVVTGDKGRAQIRMKDGAMLAIRPQTELRIDEYAHEESGRDDSSVISLIKGTFRSVTGAIGRRDREAYRVKTPVATIGIRGTDHEPMHVPQGTGGLESGTYDKVNHGATYLETEGGRVELGPNQVGYAGSRGGAPMRLPRVPDAYGEATSASGEDSVSADEDEQAGADEEETAAGGETGTDGSDPEPGNTQADASSTEGDTTLTSTESATVADSGTLTTTAAITADGTAVNLTDNTVTTPEGTSEPLESGMVISVDTPGSTGRVAAGSFVAFDGYGFYAVPEWLGHEPYDQIRFDAGGNLIGVRYGEHGDRVAFDLVNPRNASRQQASSHELTGLEWGRVQVDRVEYTYIDELGNTIVDSHDLNPYGNYYHWIVAAQPWPEYIPEVFRGTIDYVLDGGTVPTDQNGVDGTLSHVSLSANFTDMTVGFDVQVSTADGDWQGTASGVPLRHSGFYADSYGGDLSIMLNGSAVGYGAVSGGFAGENLAGAYLGYGFYEFENGLAVSGVAGLQATNAPSSAIDHRVVIFGGYDPRWSADSPSYERPMLADGAYNHVDDITLSGSSLTRFSGYLHDFADSGDRRTEFDATGLSVVDTGVDPDTGIIWGRWEQPTTPTNIATYLDDGTSAGFNPGNLHYLAGPQSSEPAALPTTGTFSYTFAGGTNPTDNHGNVGTLNSAALTANFTDMTVDASVNATVAGLTLEGAAKGARLEGIHFGAGWDMANPLAVSCTGGCAGGASYDGQLVGGFVGAQAEGAGVAYALRQHVDDGTAGTVISGVAALKR